MNEQPPPTARCLTFRSLPLLLVFFTIFDVFVEPLTFCILGCISSLSVILQGYIDNLSLLYGTICIT